MREKKLGNLATLIYVSIYTLLPSWNAACLIIIVFLVTFCTSTTSQKRRRGNNFQYAEVRWPLKQPETRSGPNKGRATEVKHNLDYFSAWQVPLTEAWHTKQVMESRMQVVFKSLAGGHLGSPSVPNSVFVWTRDLWFGVSKDHLLWRGGFFYFFIYFFLRKYS